MESAAIDQMLQKVDKDWDLSPFDLDVHIRDRIRRMTTLKVASAHVNRWLRKYGDGDLKKLPTDIDLFIEPQETMHFFIGMDGHTYMFADH